MMCNFWDMKGAEREAMKNVWLSNLAIIGGLLIAASQATN
jgi:putative oxidoreductase